MFIFKCVSKSTTKGFLLLSVFHLLINAGEALVLSDHLGEIFRQMFWNSTPNHHQQNTGFSIGINIYDFNTKSRNDQNKKPNKNTLKWRTCNKDTCLKRPKHFPQKNRCVAIRPNQVVYYHRWALMCKSPQRPHLNVTKLKTWQKFSVCTLHCCLYTHTHTHTHTHSDDGKSLTGVQRSEG